MKKNSLALLILLVACVTIAGSYATWNYTSANNIDAITSNLSVAVADKNVTTIDGGTLSATGTMTASIDNGGNYQAALVMGGDNIVVTYTPNPENPTAATSINMYATITLTSVAKYNNQDVVKVVTGQINSAGAVSTWQITPAEIGACLQIADITLPKEADYDAFAAAMQEIATTITITIAAN